MAGEVSTSNGSTALGSQANHNGGMASPLPFLRMTLFVENARLNNLTGLLKPNPYTEVIVDGKPPKKTEISKSSYHPKWHTEMSLHVTPYSKLVFRVYDHSTFKKDALLGDCSLDLYSVAIWIFLYLIYLHFLLFFVLILFFNIFLFFFDITCSLCIYIFCQFLHLLFIFFITIFLL